jgi:hypothetical protein
MKRRHRRLTFVFIIFSCITSSLFCFPSVSLGQTSDKVWWKTCLSITLIESVTDRCHGTLRNRFYISNNLCNHEITVLYTDIRQTKLYSSQLSSLSIVRKFVLVADEWDYLVVTTRLTYLFLQVNEEPSVGCIMRHLGSPPPGGDGGCQLTLRRLTLVIGLLLMVTRPSLQQC